MDEERKNEAVSAKFFERRAERATRKPHERTTIVDCAEVKRKAEKTEGQVDEEVLTYRWRPLEKVCLDSDIDPTEFASEEDLCMYIEQTYDMVCARNKSGKMGVEVPLDEDGTHLVKRRKQDTISKTKEFTGTPQEVTGRFEQMKAKFALKQHTNQHLQAASRRLGKMDVETDPALVDTPAQIRSAHSIAGDPSDADDDDDAPTIRGPWGPQPPLPVPARGLGSANAPTVAYASPTPASLRSVGGQRHQAQDAQSPAPKSLKSVKSPGGQAGDPEEGGEGAGAGSGRKRRSQAEVIRDGAEAAIDAANTKWTWVLHWEARNQQKAYDAIIGRLHLNGEKAGQLYDDSKAGDLSTTCFKISETLTTRQNLFEALRLDFLGFIKNELCLEYLKCLQEAPDQVVAAILTTNLNQTLSILLAQADIVPPWLRYNILIY